MPLPVDDEYGGGDIKAPPKPPKPPSSAPPATAPTTAGYSPPAYYPESLPAPAATTATTTPGPSTSWLKSLIDRVKQAQDPTTAPAENPFIPPPGERKPDRLADELGMSTGALSPEVERLLTGRPDGGRMPRITELEPARPSPQERRQRLYDRYVKSTGLDPVVNQAISGPAGSTMVVPSANPQITDEGFQDWLDERRTAQGLRPKPERDERGRPTGGKPARPDVDPMTLAEYEALDPQQRAAVDFNTMLVQAVRTDRRMRKLDRYEDVPKQQRANYEQAVEDIFGRDGGSKRYAPETLAVLNQIEFKDDSADLDQFLNLRAAITEKDLKHLAGDISSAPEAEMYQDSVEALPEGQEVRVELANTLASSTAQMQEQLTKGVKLMREFDQAALQLALNEEASWFGGVHEREIGAPGFGDWTGGPNGEITDKNSYFQVAFNDLANATDPRSTDEIIATIRQDLAGVPGDFKEFLDYASVRSRDEKAYVGQVLGGVQYRSPQEFRQLLRESLKPRKENGDGE